MCFHDLWFLPFSSWVVGKLNMEKVVKETDDNIANFKQYDHFYLLLTLGIVVFLNGAINKGHLNFPLTFLT
jgi:hypothetical protein